MRCLQAHCVAAWPVAPLERELAVAERQAQLLERRLAQAEVLLTSECVAASSTRWDAEISEEQWVVERDRLRAEVVAAQAGELLQMANESARLLQAEQQQEAWVRELEGLHRAKRDAAVAADLLVAAERATVWAASASSSPSSPFSRRAGSGGRSAPSRDLGGVQLRSGACSARSIASTTMRSVSPSRVGSPSRLCGLAEPDPEVVDCVGSSSSRSPPPGRSYGSRAFSERLAAATALPQQQQPTTSLLRRSPVLLPSRVGSKDSSSPLLHHLRAAAPTSILRSGDAWSHEECWASSQQQRPQQQQGLSSPSRAGSKRSVVSWHPSEALGGRELLRPGSPDHLLTALAATEAQQHAWWSSAKSSPLQSRRSSKESAYTSAVYLYDEEERSQGSPLRLESAPPHSCSPRSCASRRSGASPTNTHDQLRGPSSVPPPPQQPPSPSPPSLLGQWEHARSGVAAAGVVSDGGSCFMQRSFATITSRREALVAEQRLPHELPLSGSSAALVHAAAGCAGWGSAPSPALAPPPPSGCRGGCLPPSRLLGGLSPAAAPPPTQAAGLLDQEEQKRRLRALWARERAKFVAGM